VTVTEFRASRRWSDDISADTGYGYDPATRGYIYAGGLYIINLRPDTWMLPIYDDEKISTYLAELEDELYTFGTREGVF
jgi:hypothetical protein